MLGEQFLEKAIAKGYEAGGHQDGDSVRDSTKDVKKTLRDQDWALGRQERRLKRPAQPHPSPHPL